MRIVRYRAADGGARVGVVEGGIVYDAGTSVVRPEKDAEVAPLTEVTLLAPVPRPHKIVCVGLNYVDHAEETGLPIPETPTLFAKFDNAVVGHGEPIRIPAIAKETDYEAELGVVIGTQASAVRVEDALDYVLGYTCVNDVSARDLQFADGQWTRGKSLDSYCPIGPWIVTTDEIPDPQTLGIRCVVNGVTLQDSSTKVMIRSVAELISFISEAITLEAGDVIATGTPSGVGFKREPAVYLRPGDVVRVEIDGIGVLENPVEARES